MNFEKFTGSLEQTEKYGIKYNSNMPVTKRWYRYDRVNDSISFLNEGDHIISFSYDQQRVLFVSDAGMQAYMASFS